MEPPSAIKILPEGFEASLKMLELAGKYKLTARRVHDARHAATALTNGVQLIYTYDVSDWEVFRPEGLTIIGPPGALGSK